MFQGKNDMRKHLLNEYMPSKAWDKAVQSKLKEVFASHAEYRKLVPFASKFADSPDCKTACMTWPPSAVKFAKFIETIAFGKDMDSTVRYGLRTRKSPQEMMDFERFTEVTTQIEDDLTNETRAQPSPPAPAPEEPSNEGPGGEENDDEPEDAALLGGILEAGWHQTSRGWDVI